MYTKPNNASHCVELQDLQAGLLLGLHYRTASTMPFHCNNETFPLFLFCVAAQAGLMCPSSLKNCPSSLTQIR